MYVRNFSTGAKWLIGKVVCDTGPVSYLIVLNDGHLIRRHVDHIRKRLNLEIPDVSVDPNISFISNLDDIPISLPTVNNPTDLTSRLITPNIEERCHEITEPISTAGGNEDASLQRRSLAGYVNLPENDMNRFVMAITFTTKNYGGRVLYIETLYCTA